jgi:hypothetical protein
MAIISREMSFLTMSILKTLSRNMVFGPFSSSGGDTRDVPFGVKAAVH